MEHRSIRPTHADAGPPNSWPRGEGLAKDTRVRDVLIVEDHPLMAEALSLTLSHAFGLERVRVALSLKAAEASIQSGGGPDAVVLDLNLPDVAGIEGLISLRNLVPRAAVTVISAEIDPAMVSSVSAAGARGYISKSLPRAELIDSFRRMWEGETIVPDSNEPEGDADEDMAILIRNFAMLTPQQMKILRQICQGRPNKIISYELSITEATVKTHIAAIMHKINVRNRTQAALLANKARLFTR